MSKPILSFILLTLLAGLMACNSTPPATSNDVLAPLPTIDPALPTLVELLSADPNLVFFTSGLNNAGLTDDLQNDGPFTVFAPSNVAFSEAGLIVSQMDPALLGEIMDHHVVDGTFSEAELAAAGSVVTLVGAPLLISQDEGEALKVGYVPLISEARLASNGMLYVIDSLLLPPETGPDKSMWGVLQADGRFTTFVSYIEGTDMMGPLRFGEPADAVLAPTDEAFANIPAEVAAYLESDPDGLAFAIAFHFLSPDGWPQGTDLTVADMAELGEISTHVPIGGSGFGRGFEKLTVETTGDVVQIGGATIVDGDIDATNGIIHAIDTVLFPPSLLEHTQ